MKKYSLMLATILAFMFIGCGGGDSSDSSSDTRTISGYVEDDAIPNAVIILKSEDGIEIEEVHADTSGYYSLSTILEKGKTYYINASGKLGDKNITMNGAFEFDTDSLKININPLTEIVYQLYLSDKSISLKDRNKDVLMYFGIAENSDAVGTRFKTDSAAYIGMKKLAGDGIPLDVVENFTEDIKAEKTDLRAMVRDTIKIIPSVSSAEVNAIITFSLDKEVGNDYEVRWIGLSDESKKSLTSSYTGDKEITVRVMHEGSLVLEDSLKVNFYKVSAPIAIAIVNNSVDTNVTASDIKISVPKDCLPAGVDTIRVTNIDKGSTDSLKTLKFEPSGTVFNTPIEIRVPYDLATVTDPSTLYIERLEDDGTIEILKPTIDYKTQELIFKTDHFSIITIKDSSGRDYLKDGFFTGIDAEDDLFFASGNYSIPLMNFNPRGFGQFLEYMTSGSSPLKDAVKVNLTQFLDDGWNGINNFDNSYEEAMKYVLAEEVSGFTKMTKYEVLIDSLVKYRIASLIDSYVDADMLKVPKKSMFSTTTRSDFFNEFLKVEDQKYGLYRTFKAGSMAGYESMQANVDLAKSINSEYLNILENGIAFSGTGLAVDFLKEYIVSEVKYSLTKHITNENLSYLQCFTSISESDYKDTGYFYGEDGKKEETYALVDNITYSIGENDIFKIDYHGHISDVDTTRLTDVIDYLESWQDEIDPTGDEELKAFADCTTRKIKLLEEDTVFVGNFAEGVKTLLKSSMRNDVISKLKSLKRMIDDKELDKYLTVLKLINFDKKELEEYSKHLKVVAAANAAPIIESIMIEKKLIDGDTFKDMRVEDANFLSSPAAKKEAFVKFVKYYKARDARSSTTETTDKVSVYSMEAFKNFKLSIDKKYIDDFSLNTLTLDINTIDLTKKASTSAITESYYESVGEIRNFVIKASDIKKEDYIYNADTKKYEITIGDLFASIDVSDPAYLDIKLSINMTYKKHKLYLERSIEFIADDTDDIDITVAPVTRGGFKIIVKDDTSTPLSDVVVSVGSSICTTDSTGICILDSLVPAEYDVTLTKEGYLPEYKDSFIDVGTTKELEFTLKKYDTDASMILDVSAVRSEARPLEYSFYISALGEDLDIDISFGDDVNTSGSIVSVLAGKSYITHTYASSGVKDVSVKITSSTGTTLTKALKAYPVSSDKVVEVIFLVDLSGSYGSSLAQFKSQATEIANGFTTLGSDVRVGLASFDDFAAHTKNSSDFAYREDYKLTYDFDAFNNAVDGLNLKYGGDTPESQLEGLYQVAKTFNWNDASEKYIFIATDASFHNSDKETGYPGPGYDATLAALKAKNITVIGLNRNKDIDDVTTITDATDGTVFNLDSSSSDIVEKILNFAESRSVEARSVVVPRVVGSTIQGESN